jgi:MFS family permease
MTEGIVGLSLAGISDKLGRRKTTLVFLSLNLVAQGIIIFCPWFYTRLFGYILYGCAQIKNSVCYAWLFESMETKNKSSAVTAMNMLDSFTMVGFGIYVLLISKNWLYIEIATFFLSILSFLGILIVMPESPKWFLINGKQK